MNNAKNIVRVIAVGLSSAWMISLGILIIIADCFEYFVRSKIELWEFVGILLFMIFQMLMTITVFRFFMFQRVYTIEKIDKRSLILKTQFRKYIVKRNDILGKKLGILGFYKVEVRFGDDTKKFFMKCNHQEEVRL